MLEKSSRIKDIDLEKYCLALVINHPDTVVDFPFVTENDFTEEIHRVIFSVVKAKKMSGENVDRILLANTVKNLKMRFDDDVDVCDYIEGISLIQINASKATDFFKELCTVTLRREIAQVGEKLASAMTNGKTLPASEILRLADELYNGKINYYEMADEFPDIFLDLEEVIEYRGNNPIQEFGFMGPFPKVNELYGSLLSDGNITLIGARSGLGKSSLGMCYLTWVADRYNVPILHLDCGEMSKEELQMRSVPMLTEGRVPMHMITHGTWRQNPETEKIVRSVWPRVKKIKFYYRNIGGMDRQQVINTIRRFYYSRIGRGNKVLIHYDYLKPFDLADLRTPEWKDMGHFIQEVKTLITKEIPLPFWTSLQLNRQGIIGNKKKDQIDDTENTFSISDRIYQQVSHAFLLRKKTLEEQSVEVGFGDTKLINLKRRHLGKNYQDALKPVKMLDGSFKENYIHLHFDNFYVRELGDLASTAHKFGQLTIGDEDNDGEEIV